MKPTKQTVYIPEKEENDYGYFFTPEQLNEYTQSVIKQALENAAEKAETKTEECYAGSLGNDNGELYDKIQVINKQSITNTFEETFKLFSVE